ncbi:TIGR00730 family Rossman fold protein [Spirosoma sp. HMF3257]|uniref:Cytokinin riboside 5'-monophosphate phosphoribohydrolase n=1 Tax=Spirosoma telluris TaxID=2183553 RepID=A0A327NU14_9BACT|nr:TIGR00730 family Rossman fold protein [Spirosoma telluris]RAI77939.1 TIGR00730 family Rossman fold protein [Spirosoma telluris]
MSLRVCVYCASSNQVAPIYFEAVDQLAIHLVNHHVTVIYGGGGIGLMGRLADSVLSRGGRIIGIMPEFMRTVEWAHKGINEFRFVDDMHERKKAFLDGTDALIALPGGCGTLEELLEAITLKRLGLFTKPILIVNTNRFYDPLIAMLERCIDENFMAPVHRRMWTVIDHPSQAIEAIQQAPVWDVEAIKFATLT